MPLQHSPNTQTPSTRSDDKRAKAIQRQTTPNQGQEVFDDPSRMQPNQILQLQRTIGNRAVAGLLNRGDNSAPARQQVNQRTNQATISRSPAARNTIQRTHMEDKAGAYYSNVLQGQRITENNSVITATASKDDITGGHSAVYIESLSKETGQPRDVKIHLTYDSEKNHTHIDLEYGRIPHEPNTRSWVKSAANADAAISRAEEIKAQPQSKKKYRVLGGSATKGGMNCAKFSERILKAAGIKASSGLIIKRPGALAKGKNKGHVDTLNQDTENFTKERTENLEKHRNVGKTQLGFGQMNQTQPLAKLRITDEEENWLDNVIGMEELNNNNKEDRKFTLAKDLPGWPCGRNGENKRASTTIPANIQILIVKNGLEEGEVVIDAKQAYHIVSLPLLYDSVVKK